MENENYINLIKKLSPELSDGELLELFFKNANEETFHNVVADLFNGNTQRDKKDLEIIRKLKANLEWLSKNAKAEPVDSKTDWLFNVNNFIECAGICGFTCKENQDGTYQVYMNY